MGYRKIALSILIIFEVLKLSGQDLVTVYGNISDTTGYSVGFANITLPGTKYGATADKFGQYSIQIPKTNCTLIVTCVGYQNEKIIVDSTNSKTIKKDIIIKSSIESLEEVKVSSRSETSGTIQRIDTKTLLSMPNENGGIENIIKQMPGVASNNELSSQYSVRGGSFDENLVYVNNIEVYKPMLIQSGQQEGLSFVNPDLVGSLKFSAGGFDATYGDKMSSVLDITYKKPTENKGSASASLLGGSIHFEGISKNKKFRHLTGFRYKTSQYLLNSMDTKGEYNPSFIDFQTYLTYDIAPKFEVSFLGNYGQNTYDFIPTDRVTEFGTFQQQEKLSIYFEGQEKDLFQNDLGAFTFNYHPSDNFSLRLIGSAYSTTESETYDILGQYRISDLDKSSGNSSQSDSANIIGVGSFLNHARDYLDTRIFAVSHIGDFNFNNNKLKWGITIQQEIINDRSNEWNLVDSAGYISPYSDHSINLLNARHSDYNLNSNRLTGYIQNTYELDFNSSILYFTGGLRANYWSLNKQLVFNPRFSISYKPNWQKNLLLYFSCGYYNQPPFYKELLNPAGNINRSLKAQQSINYVLGSDYIFYALARPFKMTTELYYKNYSNIDPYRVDNVRIIYAGKNIANGYAQGLDVKINGEFVKGTESWVSVSLLSTEEIIKKQFLVNGSDTFALSGYYPRPMDQLINMSFYFQDYLPKYPTYKVHLSGHYGSELPVTIPMSKYWNNVQRILPSYKRVDIGVSKIIKNENTLSNNRILNYFKEVSIGAEIFNVLGINNTISYLWIKSINNQNNTSGYFGVPNYLTGRRINLKLSATF
jgi:hypothetical protein